VLRVDPLGRQAELDPRATYAAVVDATLPFGLAPQVVPAPVAVRVGVAARGLGAGSSSFRHGTVRDGLVGRGPVRMALEPVRPYVHLRHLRLGSPGQLLCVVDELRSARRWDGEEVSFAEGLVVGAQAMFLSLGSWAGSAPFAHSYRGGGSYGRSVRSRLEDYLTVRDYLRRWDVGGWLSPAAAPLQAVRAALARRGPGEVALPVEELVARSRSLGDRPLRFWPLRPAPGQMGRVAVRLR
jgi:hypothetical protein